MLPASTPTVDAHLFGLARRINATQVVAIALATLLAGIAACSKDRPATPTAPGGAPQVSAVVSPVPLPARALTRPAGMRYHFGGEITFQELAGVGGRISALQLGLTASDGSIEWRTVTVDLPLSARGTVRNPLPEGLELSDGRGRVTIRVGANGVDNNGQAFTVAPVEVPLSVTRVDTGEMSATAPDAIFVGAGDIAPCNSRPTEATARLLDRMPGTVFTLGDNTYMHGSAEEYANCYGPTWGRHKGRTVPVLGNHDWDEYRGVPYFNYFGAAAGPPGLGYYAVTVGAWRVLVFNSNLPAHAGSPQFEWARRELFANGAFCTAALWHHPVFSSGENGGDGRMRDAWRLLQRYGADLVLQGHDHGYERFAPQSADGLPDPRGIRSFVAGTGGGELTAGRGTQPNSEIRNHRTFGVLKLTLRARDYAWEFVPIDGYSFRDSGSAACTAPDL